jgi:hypothetical protein
MIIESAESPFRDLGLKKIYISLGYHSI